MCQKRNGFATKLIMSRPFVLGGVELCSYFGELYDGPSEMPDTVYSYQVMHMNMNVECQLPERGTQIKCCRCPKKIMDFCFQIDAAMDQRLKWLAQGWVNVYPPSERSEEQVKSGAKPSGTLTIDQHSSLIQGPVETVDSPRAICQ